MAVGTKHLGFKAVRKNQRNLVRPEKSVGLLEVSGNVIQRKNVIARSQLLMDKSESLAPITRSFGAGIGNLRINDPRFVFADEIVQDDPPWLSRGGNRGIDATTGEPVQAAYVIVQFAFLQQAAALISDRRAKRRIKRNQPVMRIVD